MRVSKKEIENKKNQIVTMFVKNAGNISKLCEKAKITRKTFYVWMEDDENFRERIEAEQEALLDYTESKHFENIMAGKESSIIFTLKTKGKSRGWVEQQHVHHTGSAQPLTGITVEIVHRELGTKQP